MGWIVTRLRQGFGGHAKKQVLRALVIALVLPGGLILLAAVSILAGAACVWLFFRELREFARSLVREAEATQTGIEQGALPEDVRVEGPFDSAQDKPRFWSRGSNLPN